MDECANNVFHILAKHDNASLLNTLLDFTSYAYMNMTNNEGLTPFLCAVIQGHINVVKAMIKCKLFDIMATTTSRQTTLHLAVEKQNPDMVSLLVGYSYLIDRRDDTYGDTCLHYAIKTSRDAQSTIIIIKLLLRHGADISKVNNHGEDALCVAAKNGSEDVVRLLLKSLSRENTSPCTNIMTKCGSNRKEPHTNIAAHALIAAAKNNHANIVKYLMTGADYMDIKTALLAASSTGACDVINTLLDFLPPACVSKSSGLMLEISHICRDVLLTAVKSGQLNVILQMPQKGLHPTVDLETGWSLLHHAMSAGHVTLIEALCLNCCEVDALDVTSQTPLMKGLLNNNIEAVKTLVKFSPDLEISDYTSCNALMIGALEGLPHLMQLLIDRGSSVNEQDLLGNTALHKAIGRGNTLAAEILIKNHCDLEITNIEGNTSLILAILKKDIATVINILNATTANSGQDWYSRFQLIQSSHSLQLMKVLFLHYSLSAWCILYYSIIAQSSHHSNTSFNKEFLKWSAGPLTLMDSCRVVIRQQLAYSLLWKVKLLPLPKLLQRFVLLYDFV